MPLTEDDPSSGNHELFDDIMRDLKDRSEWEERQTIFYKMRHGGLRRSNKPYPNAPDQHFPLGDAMVEKLKPFYVQQIYASDTLASFVSLQEQKDDFTSAVASWFDYKLKQKSNFERELMCGVDLMVSQAGFCPIKIYWDNDCKQLCFVAKDPLHIIVPKNTVNFEDADRVVDVIQLSEAQYRRNKNFCQDEDFIKSIKGKGSGGNSATSTTKSQEVARREGITYGVNDDKIVLWEIWARDESGKVFYETIAPVAPNKLVRPRVSCPYNKGVFAKEDRFPFFRINSEIKDKGWLANRGAVERVAPMEVSMCKMWNSQLEHMDYFANPTYTATADFPNTSNIKQAPGQILPTGVTPNPTQEPPVAFQEQLQFLRATAEYLIGIPDLGAGQHLSGEPSGQGDVTARQISAVVQQSSISDDLRARVFRKDLATGYQMSYSILLQFDSKTLQYVTDKEVQNLDGTALHDKYEIEPNGSADGWNRGLQLQKAMARFQMFKGDPYTKQDELRKSVWEVDDPRLVNRLFQDQGDEQKSQAAKQADELATILSTGLPVEVQPTDDDKVHFQAMMIWGQQRMQSGVPPTPAQAQLLLLHGHGHDQGLEQKKDPMLRQVRQQMAPMIQILGQIAAQGQQQPQNVIPGPGSQPQSDPNDQAKNQIESVKASTDRIKAGALVANAIAALKKAGVVITETEINDVMKQMNLTPAELQPVNQQISPPLQPQQQIS